MSRRSLFGGCHAERFDANLHLVAAHGRRDERTWYEDYLESVAQRSLGTAVCCRGTHCTSEPDVAKAGPYALDLAAGSMAPKVEAVCSFIQHGGWLAGIGALTDAAAILHGDAGTVLRSGDAEYVTFAPAERGRQPQVVEALPSYE